MPLVKRQSLRRLTDAIPLKLAISVFAAGPKWSPKREEGNIVVVGIAISVQIEN